MKPVIVTDDRVGTRFITYRDTDQAALDSDLVDRYENNEIIVMENSVLPLSASDWAFLDTINLPLQVSGSNEFKKPKAWVIATPIHDYSKHVLYGMFGKDGLKTAERFRELVIRVTKHVRTDVVEKLFPSYRITDDKSLTWRMTRTEAEDMHFDSYGTSEEDDHFVRVFVNLDNQPRLWGVGPQVCDAINMYRHRLPDGPDRHPNMFNSVLNKIMPWAKVPRHFALFMQDNMWLVNSQAVAHEAIFGRKLLACSFVVDPNTMNNPEKSFANTVRKTLKEIGR